MPIKIEKMVDARVTVECEICNATYTFIQSFPTNSTEEKDEENVDEETMNNVGFVFVVDDYWYEKHIYCKKCKKEIYGRE
jgi:hypothetical protein